MAFLSSKKARAKAPPQAEPAAPVMRPDGGPAVTGEDWQRQVAIAAYHRWLARGAIEGDDQADWYAAEADLNGRRKAPEGGRAGP
jgi:hypothetical protein